MSKIVVLGAGKSATTLIHYLSKQSIIHGWQLAVGDIDINLVKEKLTEDSNVEAFQFDVLNEAHRAQYTKEAKVVISLLPYKFHPLVAEACLANNTHLVTASYIDDTCKAMDAEFRKNGLAFIGESGLDPGIDHMAIMEIIHRLKSQGAKLDTVLSYTGALIAPESNDNPWKYKFSWAPMNVVMAGQGVSQYLHEQKNRFIPYNRIFKSYFKREIENVGSFEIYPNRNSRSYLTKYELPDVKTFLRGTVRYNGFCDAWNCLVRLGWTDNSYVIDLAGKTYADLLRSYLPLDKLDGVDLKTALANYLDIDMEGVIMAQIEWLGILEEQEIGMEKSSPAQMLCNLLGEKWKMNSSDKDMVIMVHEMIYELDGKLYELKSSMNVLGTDEDHTAIAKTVGLPAGIIAKMLMNDELKVRGVRIPLLPEIYKPVLNELAEQGIVFKEECNEIHGFSLV